MPVLVLHVINRVVKHLLHVPMLLTLYIKLFSELKDDFVSQLNRLLLVLHLLQHHLVVCVDDCAGKSRDLRDHLG